MKNDNTPEQNAPNTAAENFIKFYTELFGIDQIEGCAIHRFTGKQLWDFYNKYSDKFSDKSSMKTALEILSDHVNTDDLHTNYIEDIEVAMEEYASQFKSSDKDVEGIKKLYECYDCYISGYDYMTFPEWLESDKSHIARKEFSIIKSSQPSEVVLPSDEEIKIGSRIKFLDDITQEANEETPAFLFARKGDEGEIVKLKGDYKNARYCVKWDKWEAPFYADLGKDFIIIQSPPPTKEIGETLSKERIENIAKQLANCRVRILHPVGSNYPNLEFEAKELLRIEMYLLKLAEAICSLAISKGEDGWISVDDRLPKENEDVLVCTSKGVMCKSHNLRISDKSWFGYGEAFHTYNVTHWKPLPNPPKK